ncbi:AraC family transcriptional regulator [Oceanicaulis alexandrii]|uniref:AraC family transcriptional regulator n=1 Tax=Oceanicaulis alexandrii TaxID=153233 RepID=UPI00235634C6|nr:AraC family transcriptional regulator [Oceanicaulis alexandrii]
MSTPNTDPRPRPDPLTALLDQLKLTGTLYCQTDMAAPWGIALPAFEGLSLIAIVLDGACQLQLDGEAPVLLKAGDLALIPNGVRHDLFSDPEADRVPLDKLDVTPLSQRYETLTLDGPGPRARITYGVVRFDQVLGAQLMAHLPRLIVSRGAQDEDSWITSTLAIIARESEQLSPGSEAIITRLTDVLVIQLVRSWLATEARAQTGWLAALRDPHLGRALTALHDQPQRDWTVEALAREAGLSRSIFAARFTEQLGRSAISYLTQWRLHLAHRALSDTRTPMIEIAEAAGYSSEAAFSRAFKRQFGHAPGAVRRDADPA